MRRVAVPGPFDATTRTGGQSGRPVGAAPGPRTPSRPRPVDVPEPTFALHTDQDGDAAVVRVVGELDLATAPQLRELLANLVARGSRHVTLDLADMDFIDSTGLKVFVAGLQRLRDRGGELALQSPSAAALRVFEITGLTTIFANPSGNGPRPNPDEVVRVEDMSSA